MAQPFHRVSPRRLSSSCRKGPWLSPRAPSPACSLPPTERGLGAPARQAWELELRGGSRATARACVSSGSPELAVGLWKASPSLAWTQLSGCRLPPSAHLLVTGTGCPGLYRCFEIQASCPVAPPGGPPVPTELWTPVLGSAAADTPTCPPPGGSAGPVPAQPGAAGVGGDAAEDRADRSAAVAGRGRGHKRSWPRLVSLTWPWVPVAWRAPPGEALKGPCRTPQATFWLPSLQPL